MPRFLIEVPHSSEYEACLRAIQALLSTGSHYVTHTEWGCEDGVHTAWLIVELDSKEDALRVVPPAFRGDARVTRLSRFSLEEAEKLLLDRSRGQSG